MMVKYYKKDDTYYKVHHELKQITSICNNVVVRIDYDENIENVKSFKSIKMNQWKHIENSFFISRQFKWKHNNTNYITTDNKLEWKPAITCGRETIVFHNGKIWTANDYYYPKIHLTRIEYNKNEVNTSNLDDYFKKLRGNQKWTDIKYCKNFEINLRVEKIEKLLKYEKRG